MRQEILPIERKPKILLIAINAKYIHSNLAVHSLKAYAQEYQDFIEIAEYTINHRVSYLLQEIYKQKPDILCFSCYIWNLRQVQELIVELHKLLPQAPIWVGGPEVSYEPEPFWQYIKDHDNGVTNFHFEISADLLTEEELALLSSLRPGLVQLEIGVQSTHTPTIREIRRTMDLPRLQNAFCHIQQAGNIHQHLDLIAGLPEEGFEDFAESFRQVYLWKPQQLQLGFLKVLKGSRIYGHREEYGLICQQYPPYEVLATKWISYDELLDIKLVEEMLEVYYNSAQFVLTMKVLELTCENPFFLYLELGRFYERQGLLAASHSRLRRAEILLEFARERDGQHLGLYQESLTFDLYSRENMKTRPSWSPAPASYKAETRRYCLKGKLSHLEPFCYDMEFLQESRTIAVYPSKLPEKQFWLFDYEDRNPLDRQAKAQKVQ